MGGSVEGLLDSRPQAGRGGNNAAVVTCISMASCNFISAAVLDISRKVTSAKEKGFTVSTIDCIPVHQIHVSPATTFNAGVY